VTAGGRVLGITAVARGPEEARRRAYAGVAGIGWPGAQVRTDIGAAANTIGSAAVIGRYSPKDMAALFTDEARLAMWLEVELLAAEGLARIGVVPLADVIELRERAPVVDADFRPRRGGARGDDEPRPSPPSSTWSKSGSANRSGRGSTTGSPRRTWSTPRRAPRS